MALKSIDERPLLRLLQKKSSSQDLSNDLVRMALDRSLTYEEKRSVWYFLLSSGRYGLAIHSLLQAIKNKDRIPFDVLVNLTAKFKIKPPNLITEAVLKGMRKLEALEDVISAKAWDSIDSRFAEVRNKILEKKYGEQNQFRENLKDKFHFLMNQRMEEQARRVLGRMLDLYPEDAEFLNLKDNFEEQWARNVLANHRASTQFENHALTRTQPSAAEDEMLDCFLKEGEKICLEQRDFAADLATTFLFMEEHSRALDIIAWAPVNRANDWMRAELLVRARRFIEALELLLHLEVKYVNDPETSFAVSYLRAQCLQASGQSDVAVEMLKSIVRLRPNYRSAQALIMKWSTEESFGA